MSSAATPSNLVDSLTERLSQSYEEINLLFQIARQLNSPDEPRQVIDRVCHQLAEVLPLRWIGIHFRTESYVAPSLAGAHSTAGSLPMPAEQFKLMAAELANHPKSDECSVFAIEKHSLAVVSGAEVFAEPISYNGQCVGVIVGGNRIGAETEISSEEIQVVGSAADFLALFHQNLLRLFNQRAQYLGTLRALSSAIDAKDPYTRGHSDRVALLTAKLANAIHLPPAQVETFRISGQLHDVGKIGVPEAVLCKTGRLTPEEFAEIQKHPEIGYSIVKDIPGMDEILPGVLHHHERWDGRGYPHGIAGDKIPLIARCIALADSFDAMSSKRSYRDTISRDLVLAEIRKVSGQQFDPELAPVFVAMDFADFDAMLASAAR